MGKKKRSTFGQRLRIELENADMTQKELSKMTGINYTQLNRYVLDQTLPDHKSLVKILTVVVDFGGDVYALLGLY